MPCLAYRRAAVSNAGSPVKPATDASHACGDSRFSTAEWGKFAVDSPLEEAGFEPSVPLWLRGFTRSKALVAGPVGVGGFELRRAADSGEQAYMILGTAPCEGRTSAGRRLGLPPCRHRR
jgi:hypothetical protein